ncbi:fimbria/pilus periplasmic chaperone [Klebsiella pneumoniae]|uniref:fimbria/pilus periplasmic chaperone n=1 Tax=Klebsiella TaxID=570 RepID=UPI000EFC1D1D|nr:molecular chaperone [Klebsiella pneumoniae]NWL97941.1 fimbria/pilus periplasmic chaperone [Klebsiella pneumoniae]NWO42196.1 fimbria/pilus periplasmic chaperone [Klebsiella pneumoniae]QPW03434.1 fimbria/pilus periplasmic chaperone [Klebsiella pneumoniae]VDY58674.1 fimbrial protein StfD [Klebsiella pneumoniae]
MVSNTFKRTLTFIIASFSAMHAAHAAIALDRTRVIFDGDRHSEALSITNQNKSLPYLAQAWVEDAHGNKIESPLNVVPPLQRVEPGAKSQLMIQSIDNTKLSQDQETLFYFNVREIPPKSDKPNTMQIALQTRVKLFYRPSGLAGKGDEIPQKQLYMTKEGDRYVVHNPTGYYVTFVHAAPSVNAGDVPGFKADMVAPKGTLALSGSAATLGNHPVLTFINDYGGRPKLLFSCTSNCTVTDIKAG